MRLLIASDAPIDFGRQADIRGWTQRMLWFAREGDAVVLSDVPDPLFLEHVTGLTGVSSSRLRFHVLPSRWTGGNFDGWSLLDEPFRKALEADAMSATDVLTLWPCAEIGWLVRNLGIEGKLPGAAFTREGGGTLANSKVVFRALASGNGIALAPGGVCRSPEDAVRISGELLRAGHAFIVKRSYGASGKGNEVVSTQVIALSHAGHASSEIVDPTLESLHAYWARRWAWASNDGANPFVVEAFVPDARTVYVEVECADRGIGVGKIGELKFENGRITREVYPVPRLSQSTHVELQRMANQLARAYVAIGYRGRLSLDAVITPNGRPFFTEANARFTTSTHLYEPIAERVARLAELPTRILVQALSPASWKLDGVGSFLEGLAQHGLAFSPSSRTGLIAVTPVIHKTGQLLMAAVANDETSAEELFASAERVFRQRA